MRKERRKIVFFIGNMSHLGGTERVLSTIANGLSERGYEVFIVSLWGKGNIFFTLRKTVKLFWVEEKAGQFNIMKQFIYLISVLKRIRPDVWVDVDIILGAYSVFLKRLKPAMRWISWEHFSCYYQFDRNDLLRRIVKKLVCRFSDQLIVLTEIDKKYYQMNYRLKCKIDRIYNPIPYEMKHHKQKEEKMIIAVGRLTYVKGFDLLIRSWRMLESKYPEWLIVIAGEGEERKRLEEEIRKADLKRIHFIGNVHPIEEYYKKAAFLVLPSRNEPFGMVLIEAMYFGLPVVSFSCESGPREIICDGENGLLAEEENAIDLAEKIEMLMRNRDLCERMGKSASRSARRFEKKKILDQWEKILQANN